MLVLTFREGEGVKIFHKGQTIDVIFVARRGGNGARIGIVADKDVRIERMDKYKNHTVEEREKIWGEIADETRG